MNTIILLAIVGVGAIFITMQTVHGQGQTMTQEQREFLINYCYQHADRPNPIHDLIDKGFLSSSFKGETCLSVNQEYDRVQAAIDKDKEIQREKQEALKRLGELEAQGMFEGQQDMISRYRVCLQNTTTTYEECYKIYNEIDFK